MTNSRIKKLINSIERIVESEKLAGVSEIFCAGRSEKKVTLKELKETVLSCQKCQLYKQKTNYVFGEGPSRSFLMFVGEAPGREEDKQGRPFVGRAGGLLTKIIESIGLERKEVFICNILKCRPPENRSPMPGEIAACCPYLMKQIELVKPKVICALGKSAAQTLLNTDVPISKLRGNFLSYQGIKLMPTYHPAYLLRNPNDKKYVWEDIQKVARELGLEIPKHKRTK